MSHYSNILLQQYPYTSYYSTVYHMSELDQARIWVAVAELVWIHFRHVRSVMPRCIYIYIYI